MIELAHGAWRKRHINGDLQDSASFMGLSDECKLGLGVRVGPSNCVVLWSIVPERRIIQCWRAMLMLSHMHDITAPALSAAWHVFDTTPGAEESTAQWMRHMGWWEYEQSRRIIQTLPPDGREFDAILCQLHHYGLVPQAEEFTAEAAAGRLVLTPRMQHLIDEEEAFYQRWVTMEARVQETPPPEHSLQHLLIELGITGLIEGEAGVRGVDWQYLDITRLDEEIIRASLYHQEVLGLQSTPGEVTHFGPHECQAPAWRGPDGTLFVFEGAHFHDQCALVHVTICGPEQQAHSGIYTLPHLREIMGL